MQKIANKLIKEIIFGVYEISKIILIISASMYALMLDTISKTVLILSVLLYAFAKGIMIKKSLARAILIVGSIVIAGYLYKFVEYTDLYQLIMMFLISMIFLVRTARIDSYERNFSAFKLSFWMSNALYLMLVVLFRLISDVYYMDDFGIFIPIMIITGMFKIMYLNMSIAYQKKYRNGVDYDKNLFKFTVFNFVGMIFLGMLFVIDKAVVDLNAMVDWLIEHIVIVLLYPILYIFSKIAAYFQGIDPKLDQIGNASEIAQEIDVQEYIVPEYIENIAYGFKWVLLIVAIYFIWRLFSVNKSEDSDDEIIDESKSYMSASEIKMHYKNKLNIFTPHDRSQKTLFFRYYWKMVKILHDKNSIDYKESDTALEYQNIVNQKANEDIKEITKDYNDIVYGGLEETNKHINVAKETIDRIKRK